MDTAFQLDVCLPDGRTLPVQVTRKRVRNLNLRVRADGSVALSVPPGASAAAAQDFLDRRAAWIAERMDARERAAEAALVPASGPDAGTLPLWGELVAAADALGIEDPAALPADELRRRIDVLYRREVARVLPDLAARIEADMGVAAARWSVRTMKTRWGSCTPRTAAIRINAALAAYPPSCLEYVVAHELAHLMEPSHNRRFHMLLGIYCPDNRTAAAVLKRPAREVAAR